MENIILDGKQTSKDIIEALKEKFEKEPTDKKLAIVSVGDDYGSAVYCNMKKKKSEYIGIGCDVFHFEEDVTQEEIDETLTAYVKELIEEGVNGMTFESRNIDDLAKKIEIMMNKSFDYADIARTAQDKYSSETYYQKLMQIYDNV